MKRIVRNRVERLVERLAGIRVILLFGFHAVVFWVCYVLATLVRFEFEVPAHQIEGFEASLPIVVGVQLLMGAAFGFYRGWWRYVGISDVVRLFAGLTTAQLFLLAVWFTAPELEWASRLRGVSRGALLIDWAFALLTLFGARVVIRLFRDRTRRERVPMNLRKVLIIGAGDAGEALAREIQHRPQLGMKIVGFLDDHQAKWNSHIRGIPVLGDIERVSEFAADLEVSEALIAIPSASGKRIREIIHHLDQAGLEFKTIPGVDRLVSGEVHVSQLRPVNVEDLLRRERIDLPGDPARRLFRDKRVLITGAGGTIGSELAAQILDLEPAHLALLERSEFALYQVDKRLRSEKPGLTRLTSRHLVDIRDDDALRRVMERTKPQIVLHAAAHKHVPLGEENPVEYLQNNTLATMKLASVCEQYGVARFVFISTDKAINPTSVMGATKRAAEIGLLDMASHSSMRVTAVRFGNVLGSSGSVIPLFLEQIAAGGPITVTHPDVTRYFLRQSEAISLVLQSATLGDDRDIFMLDMGEPIRIADLARDLIALSGDDSIEVKFVGLRPGEKLFEEVRLDGEESVPTAHPQIVATRAPQPDPETVGDLFKRFHLATMSNLEDPVRILRELIPEYRPGVTSTMTPQLYRESAASQPAILPREIGAPALR